MKIATLQAALGSAMLLLSAHTASASNSHRRAHNHYGKRHSHGHEHNELMASPVAGRDLEDRDLECTFPFDDPHVVPVTQHLKNKGWAMPPDRACTVGNYCPIACKPGMVMNQWQKGSNYVYPQSMVRLSPHNMSVWTHILTKVRMVVCIVTREVSRQNPSQIDLYASRERVPSRP